MDWKWSDRIPSRDHLLLPALGAVEEEVHDVVIGQARLHHTGADERDHGERSSVELDQVRGAVVAVVVVLVHGGWLLLTPELEATPKPKP